MPKEYFSHDYHTRNKKKLAMLMHYEKVTGYGLFWIIVEMLHEDSTNWMDLDEGTYISIAKESGCEPEYVQYFIEKCITKYKVFIEQDGKFTTERVLTNIEYRTEISRTRSESGKRGGAKSAESRRTKQTGSKPEAIASENEAKGKQNEAKESKVKEIKEKESKTSLSPLPEMKKFTPHASINLPPNVLEAAELNQYTMTGKKNTQFIQAQWAVFKYERLNDQPMKYYGTMGEFTSHFLNWVRNKHPKKTENQTESVADKIRKARENA